MGGAPRPRSVIHFGIFELDLEVRELRKRGRKIKLQDQPFQVLAILLEHPGQVVTRDALHKRLWPADTFVDFDQGINKAINRIREALGDLAGSARFIETLPRRGYRFIASIEVGGPEAHAVRPPDSRDALARDHLVRASLLPPPNTSFLPGHFALSPDGMRLAFVATGPDGKNMLWVRALSAAESNCRSKSRHPLTGSAAPARLSARRWG